MRAIERAGVVNLDAVGGNVKWEVEISTHCREEHLLRCRFSHVVSATAKEIDSAA